MNPRRRGVAPALALACLLAACERPQSPIWQVELRLLPEAPRPLEEVTFAIRVKTRAGEAVTGADVEVTLSLPSQGRAEKRFRTRETEAGVYTAPGTFPTPGNWQVEVKVEKGGSRQAAQFRIQVR